MLVQILNGLVYGGLLYIVSVGLVLIFGLRRVVNFAHGSLFMIGAYVGYSVAACSATGGAILAAAAALALIGALLDISILRPLQREDPKVTLLVTFGLLLVLEDFAPVVWGKDFLQLPAPAIFSGSVSIFGESFPGLSAGGDCDRGAGRARPFAVAAHQQDRPLRARVQRRSGDHRHAGRQHRPRERHRGRARRGTCRTVRHRRRRRCWRCRPRWAATS